MLRFFEETEAEEISGGYPVDGEGRSIDGPDWHVSNPAHCADSPAGAVYYEKLERNSDGSVSLGEKVIVYPGQRCP